MNDSVTFAYFVKNPFPSLGTSLDICLLSEDFQKLLLWIYCNKWSRPALVSLTSLLRFFLFFLNFIYLAGQADVKHCFSFCFF